jgi:hypothetical protein
MKRTRTFGVVVLLALLASTGVFAQEKKPAMPSEEERAKMMELWTKLATPGPDHKLLEPFVGSFDVKTVMWEYAGATASESTGTSEHVWVLGGRYVQQTFHGSFMGMPFEGIGYTGYDNYRKQFIGVWMDTMGTAMLISTGTADASGKRMTFTGEWDDAMAGKKSTMREVVRIVDNDTHVMEMYMPGPDGKEYRNMEITYTRKK